jgi:hypothetical protein
MRLAHVRLAHVRAYFPGAIPSSLHPTACLSTDQHRVRAVRQQRWVLRRGRAMRCGAAQRSCWRDLCRTAGHSAALHLIWGLLAGPALAGACHVMDARDLGARTLCRAPAAAGPTKADTTAGARAASPCARAHPRCALNPAARCAIACCRLQLLKSSTIRRSLGTRTS